MLCTLPLFFRFLRPARPIAFQITYYSFTLLSTVLFLPALGAAAMLIKCDANFKATYLDSSVACFSSAHIPNVVVALASLFSLMLVSSFYKYFVFSFELSSIDETSKLDSGFDFAFHLLRCAEVLVVLLVDSAGNSDNVMRPVLTPA